MKLHSVQAENFRPFRRLGEVRIGEFTAIVGQNDAGKSSILHALDVLWHPNVRIDEDDVNDQADINANVVIEATFSELPPQVELEPGTPTTPKEEHLLDQNGLLRIRKTFPRVDLAHPYYSVCVQDFQDPQFAKLPALTEKQLNERLDSLGLAGRVSGRGITNKDRRARIRDEAVNRGIAQSEQELVLQSNDRVYKLLFDMLPQLRIFKCETRTDVSSTEFQNDFKDLIEMAIGHADVQAERDRLTEMVQNRWQEELDRVFEVFQRHTDTFTRLTAKAVPSWDKAYGMEVLGTDRHGVDKSLAKRGSGVRRLLMVSFFEYLAGKERAADLPWIFAIEEPENCLHPGLQRELAGSFLQLAKEGYQVVVTTHSPVFAGMSPLEDLTLIVRNQGIAESKQVPDLALDEVAEELGIEPADQLIYYKGIVFVEGEYDVLFWNTVSKKLKEGGYVDESFEDAEVGFVLTGGRDNLKHWINRKAMRRLNSRFAVICDSDRKSPEQPLGDRILNWKEQCQREHGIFFITKKREAENYLHSDALARAGKPQLSFDDFSDMKALFGPNVVKVIEGMTPEEILERDLYLDDRVERHELKEIIEEVLQFSTPTNTN